MRYNQTGKNPPQNKNLPPANSLARIRSKYPTLAASEARVATWVLQQPEEIMRLSMAQVAQACRVSDTTVLRFCRNTGFQGYTDLKLSIARDLTSPTQVIHDDIIEGDTPITIARKVFMANIQALNDTLEVLDEDTLIKAIDLLTKAKRILIIGTGTSGPIVQSMFNMFFRLGLNCRAQTDSYLQLMEVVILNSDDVVVGISQSGSSVDPVLTLKQAKQNGASTICITGNMHSPVTEHADITLLSVAREARAEAIASRVAQATIIDALYVIMALNNIETAIQNEKNIWDALLPKML
ncbi:MAG TPA: MurR/RpiR family transcriptional regulator [Chloroflexi bacterium]|nr:MurR/RpiR family transcriptional regulator [Chloroflexota bacterium]